MPGSPCLSKKANQVCGWLHIDRGQILSINDLILGYEFLKASLRYHCMTGLKSYYTYCTILCKLFHIQNCNMTFLHEEGQVALKME